MCVYSCPSITTVSGFQLIHILSFTILETVDMDECLQEDMDGCLQEDMDGCSQEDMEGMCDLLVFNWL